MGEKEGSYYLSQLDCSLVHITPELAAAVGPAVINTLARAVYATEPGSVRTSFGVHVARGTSARP